MTKEEYAKSHIYKGKHEAKRYIIWRVLGPAGPAEYITVTGLNAAKEAVKGCWDWEIKLADTMQEVLW